jgi:F0F1-type ATP synthase membrane subunit b/b'
VAAWGAFGNRPGQFHSPRAVEVTAGGMLVVTDDVRIQYFDPSGAHVAELPLVLPTAAAGGRAVLQAGAKTGLTSASAPGAIAPLSADIHDQMALFQQLAQTMRNQARATRSSEVAAQVAALQSEAEKIRQAAENRFSAAVTAGLMAQGAATIAAGAAAGTPAGAVGSLTSRVGGLVPNPAEIGIKTGAVPAARRAPGGVGAISAGMASGIGSSISSGIGSSIGAGISQSGTRTEATTKEQEAAAQTRDAAQQAEDLMREMMEVIRDVRDKLAEIEQSSVETNRGIARNI